MWKASIHRSGVERRASESIRGRHRALGSGSRRLARGEWLGLRADRAGRVKVQSGSFRSGTSGDLRYRRHSDPEQDGQPLPGLAPVALQQAIVCREIDLAIEERGKSEALRFVIIDKGISRPSDGLSRSSSSIMADFATGFFAWILWLVVHIYYLIGFRNRLVVLLEWAWAYLTFQRGARLITEASKECEGGSISGLGSRGEIPGSSRSGSTPGGS